MDIADGDINIRLTIGALSVFKNGGVARKLFGIVYAYSVLSSDLELTAHLLMSYANKIHNRKT